MKVYKLLLLTLLSGCSTSYILDVKWALPKHWESSQCSASFTARQEKKVNGQLVVRYDYPAFGGKTSDQLRCIISTSFGKRFVNSDYKTINLVFVNSNTNEGLLYSFSKPSGSGPAILTVMVLSRNDLGTFNTRELEYRGPLEVFVDTFDFGSVYVQYKYKAIDKQGMLTEDGVSMLYRLMMGEQ